MRRHLRSAILVGLFVVSGVVTGACDWWKGKKTAPTTTETAPAQGAATSPPVILAFLEHFRHPASLGDAAFDDLRVRPTLARAAKTPAA